MSYKPKELRQSRQNVLERDARRRRLLVIGAVAAAVVLFVGLLGFLAWQEMRPVPRTGADVPDLGGTHIEVGASHEPYNSDPPTSGPHYADPAEAGFYEQAPADEYLVHNLEHGYVIIWYNCTDLAEADCTGLKRDILDTMQRAGNSKNTNTPKLIAVPRPAMDSRLALTAWTRLDKFEAFDRGRILDFIRAFRDTRAPEPFAP